VFSRFWFRIPDCQRAYVGGKAEISELIDYEKYAMARRIAATSIPIRQARSLRPEEVCYVEVEIDLLAIG
jgi:hypothetical protein